MARDWDQHYAAGETPWDTGNPDPELVRLVESGRVPRGRALDVGCGTGTNARYLASKGCEVVGVDVSRVAIEQAKAATPAGAPIELFQLSNQRRKFRRIAADPAYRRGGTRSK